MSPCSLYMAWMEVVLARRDKGAQRGGPCSGHGILDRGGGVRSWRGENTCQQWPGFSLVGLCGPPKGPAECLALRRCLSWVWYPDKKGPGRGMAHRSEPACPSSPTEPKAKLAYLPICSPVSCHCLSRPPPEFVGKAQVLRVHSDEDSEEKTTKTKAEN